jgi:hypothetical protein
MDDGVNEGDLSPKFVEERCRAGSHEVACSAVVAFLLATFALRS